MTTVENSSESAPQPGTTPVLSARGFSKTYGERRVLHELDLDIMRGQIHGLLGQNGSGKSTFIKALAGFHAPDDGAKLNIRGESIVLPLAPDQPQELGIAFVHQELALADPMSVMENVRVGRYRRHFGRRVSWREEREATRVALARVGLSISPDAEVGTLSAVERAMVAIARALEQISENESGVLVLDEPTAYLPHDSVERLFDAVRAAAASGFGVLFVSHRTTEVKLLTDQISILRDGRLAASAETATITEDEIVQHILGRPVEEMYPAVEHNSGEVVMQVRGLSADRVDDVSFDLHRGEVVGMTGLLGMGHGNVPYLLFGADPATAGTVDVGGGTHQLAEMTPPVAMRSGMALLPGNRLRQGADPAATVAENVGLGIVRRFRRRGRLRLREEAAAIGELLDRFQVVPADPGRLFGTLSGGNQQKALLAKWFATEPEVLLVDELTSGVDVGAKSEIFRQVRAAARRGGSVVLASTEYEDLARICDRVLVFRGGKLSAELSGPQLTLEGIMRRCLS